MTETYRIIGPPGTGKTSYLINRVQDELAQGVAPEQIVYTSFTKAASLEAKNRAISKFSGDYSADQFINFSTIHSICFRRIGLKRENVFAGSKIKEFCKVYGYDTSTHSQYADMDLELPTQVLQTESDYFEYFINWYRNMQLGFDVAFNRFSMAVDVPDNFNYASIKLYIQRRNDFKAQTNAFDFTDMLEYVLNNGITPGDDIKVIFQDEFQDLSPLLAQVASMWAKSAERYYIGGDVYQAIYCLPTGTIIECDPEDKPIESVVAGDKVITAIGSGHIKSGEVVGAFSRQYDGDLISITTQSGNKLLVTPEHILFWYWKYSWLERNNLDSTGHWYVYLMKMGDKWRIGKTDNPSVRLRFEHGAEGILPIAAYKTEQEALIWEEIYSLRYGIPTMVFYNRGQWNGEGLSQEAQDKIWDNIDSNAGAVKLLNELGKQWHGFIRPMGTSVAETQRNYIHLIALYRDHDKFKRYIYWSFGVREGRGEIRGSKFPLDLLEARQYAQQKADELGGEVFEKWPFTDAHMYLPVPAANILPGCYIPTSDCGEVIDDLVVSVDKGAYHGTVYDLHVNPSNNFVANGVFVHNSFMGADPSIMLNVKADKTIMLRQSYRCPQEVHDLSRKIVGRFSLRYQDDDFKPTGNQGLISKCYPAQLKWNDILANPDDKVFYLHRTHYLMGLATTELVQAGVPFSVLHGIESPLQTPKARIASSVYKLLKGHSIPVGDMVKLMDYLPTRTSANNFLTQGAKTDIKRIPHDRNLSHKDLRNLGFTNDFMQYFNEDSVLTPFKFSLEEKSYFKQVATKFGAEALINEPKLILSTLHGVKGMESDTVILNTNLTKKTFEGLEGTKENADAEHRLFYTAVTRSKNKVVIIQPDGLKFYYL